MNASTRHDGARRPGAVVVTLGLVLATALIATSVTCQPAGGEHAPPVTSRAPGATVPSSPSTPAAPRPANADAAPKPAAVERLRVEVLAKRPHDPEAFTQGLVLVDGRLFESTGRRGESTLREVEPETGSILDLRPLPDELFGEGLAAVGDRLIQLTWTSRRAIVYDRRTFEVVDTLPYDGEGWGLCWDGTHCIMSDGSSTLTFRDPETFRAVRRVTARLEGAPLRSLNELEYAGGRVWANVWKRDEIVAIDPASGAVVAVVDASGLLTAAEAFDADVLNGIAWDAERERFLITGKLWPHLFEVRFVPSR